MTNDSQNDTQTDTNAEIADDALTPLARAFLWVQSRAKIRLAIFILAALCALLFVLDFIIHRHAYAPYETTPGFYSLTGFLAFSFIVLGSSALRWVIARSENFYSPNSVDAEDYPESGLQRREYTANDGESSTTPSDSEQGA